MDTFAALLQRARTLGHIFFHHFGIHCATHQIRVLLISAVVITSLFYPALAIYSSSQPRLLAHFSSQILDPFVAAGAISNYYAQHDLWNVWTGQDNLRVREDSVARARCGKEQTLRLERLLIHNPAADETAGTLSHDLLLSALHLEQRLLDGLAAHKLPCLRKPDGRCLVISPLEFWKHSESAMLSDSDIMQTLSTSRGVSISGIPITREMVLAGRETIEYPSRTVDQSMFLVLTFFFPETDCLGMSGHSAWRRVLEQATAGTADLMTEAQEPALIALEFKTNVLSSPKWSVLTVFLYLAYFAFVVLFTKVTRVSLLVHNGIGLIFTGIVEMLVSTVTSLSVCALVGFRVTMIPWELFPLVILFIGMENMFTLVEAVVETSITLPVKERIAEGLSGAGTSNSLKVLSYNIILGIIAKLSDGAIRQFCAFAVVVLVAHWFLVHTFFVAVLSIDLQRLELDELLQQDAKGTPSLQSQPPGPSFSVTQSKSRWAKFISRIHGLLRGRATKNFSLLLLLATTATLYFATYPAVRETGIGVRLSRNDAHVQQGSVLSGFEQRAAPAWHIWHMLNPSEDPLVHLRVESPTILLFRAKDANDTSERQHLNPFSSRSRSQPWIVRTTVWMLRIVVLPITLTCLLLYGLLLYLLKDTERLEAQRNRAEPDAPVKEDSPVEEELSFMTLPRALASDVELIAANKDGNIIATVGLENEIAVWFRDRKVYAYIDTAELLLQTPSTSSAASTITALAVDDAGGFCAVGTGAGVIALWSLDDGLAKPLPVLVLQSASSAVTSLHFLGGMSSGVLTPARAGGQAPLPVPALVLAAYENGVVAKWSTAAPQCPTMISPSRPAPIISSTLVRLQNTSRVLATFCMSDGAAELVEASSSDVPLAIDCHILAGNPADTVTEIHASIVRSGGTESVIVAAATQAGVVSLWDGSNGECISILDEAHGQISNLRICPAGVKSCTQCGELPVDSFTLSLSVGQVVLFYRVYIPTDARRCSCSHNQAQLSSAWSPIAGRRSRSASQASSNGGLISRSRHPSLSDHSPALDTAFPISAHGGLSRRASEKDFHSRRGMGILGVQLDSETGETMIGPHYTPNTSEVPPSNWRDLVVVRAGDTTVERGSWDVLDKRIVGLRRKPRAAIAVSDAKVHVGRDSMAGLSQATLERWEVWTFDPALARLQALPLAALEQGCNDQLSTSASPASSRRSSMSSDRPLRVKPGVQRLPFTRVSRLVCGPSYCLAGFGNTVGLLSLLPCKDLERNLSVRLAGKLKD